MAVILSKAARLNERGRRLSAKGWFAEAEAAYRAAAAAKPRVRALARFFEPHMLDADTAASIH